MPLQATCPHCSTKHNLEDRLAGKKVRCKHCKQPFAVGGEVDETAVPTAPPAQSVQDLSRPTIRGGSRRPGDDDETRDDRGRRGRWDEEDEGDPDERPR